VREAVLMLAHCESAAYVRCPEASQLLPDCFDQDRNVAEYLAVLPSQDTRDCGAGVETLCAGFTAGPED
jgi:hypothetical protein